MFAASVLSLISLTSLHTGKPCHEVFEALAKSQIQIDRQLSEDVYLKQFAIEACKTNNPDIIWQIAQVETNFHFEIVRFNNTNVVLKGKKALDYLTKLETTRVPENIDIGIMQVNYYWHREFFSNNPVSQLQPKNQVKYLVERMAPIVTKSCRNQWIGCYHNPANGPRAERYNEWIFGARKALEKAAITYLKNETTQQVSIFSKIQFDAVQKQKFYSAANNPKHTQLYYLLNNEIDQGISPDVSQAFGSLLAADFKLATGIDLDIVAEIGTNIFKPISQM